MTTLIELLESKAERSAADAASSTARCERDKTSGRLVASRFAVEQAASDLALLLIARKVLSEEEKTREVGDG